MAKDNNREKIDEGKERIDQSKGKTAGILPLLPTKISAREFSCILDDLLLVVIAINAVILGTFAFLSGSSFENVLLQWLTSTASEGQQFLGKEFPLLYFVALFSSHLMINVWPMRVLHDEAILFFHRWEFCRRFAHEIQGTNSLTDHTDRKAWAIDVNGDYKTQMTGAKGWLGFYTLIILLAIVGPWAAVIAALGLAAWQVAMIVVLIGVPLAFDFIDMLVLLFATSSRLHLSATWQDLPESLAVADVSDPPSTLESANLVK